MLSMRVCSSKPAILIESNDLDSNNLAGYEERTRVLYMIRTLKLSILSWIYFYDKDTEPIFLLRKKFL